MMKNGIYVLKQNATVQGDFKLHKDQEIGVSNNVIYMGGQLLDTRLQELMMKWMENNRNLLIIDNRT
jgi:hypothetical protein